MNYDQARAGAANYLATAMTPEQIKNAQAQVQGIAGIGNEYVSGGIGQAGLDEVKKKWDEYSAQQQTGQMIGGQFDAPTQDCCPNCGYCRRCGRGGGYVPNYPKPYWSQPYWYDPYRWTITCNGQQYDQNTQVR